MKKYEIIFSDKIFRKLKKYKNKKDIQKILSKMFNKIETKGPSAGKLLDLKLSLYEIKNKKPPLRLYFEVIFKDRKAEIIDFQMKTSKDNQNRFIELIKSYIRKKFD